MAETDDRWLSVVEICKYFGIDKHGMPTLRLGRLWKFTTLQMAMARVWNQPRGFGRAGESHSKNNLRNFLQH